MEQEDIAELTEVWNQFQEIMQEFFKMLDIRIIIAIVIAVIIFIFEMKAIRKYKPRNRKKEQAIALGHSVQATRVKYWDESETGYDGPYEVVYEYEVNGKTYTYKCRIGKEPPETLELYYLDEPGRAFDDLPKTQTALAIFCYIIPFAVAMIIYCVLGGLF